MSCLISLYWKNWADLLISIIDRGFNGHTKALGRFDKGWGRLNIKTSLSITNGQASIDKRDISSTTSGSVSTNLVTSFTIHSKAQLYEHNSVAPLTPGTHVGSLSVQRVSRQGKRCDLIILCRGSVVLCIATLNWKRDTLKPINNRKTLRKGPSGFREVEWHREFLVEVGSSSNVRAAGSLLCCGSCGPELICEACYSTSPISVILRVLFTLTRPQWSWLNFRGLY